MAMEFLNQSWFWAGFFTAFASLGGILIKEMISTKTQVKIERLKLYDSDVFRAYQGLYEFISHAYSTLWPPNMPERDYRDLMKYAYFKDVKKNMLFFTSEIRDTLGKLESQYDCLIDSDLTPKKSFDEFYDKDLGKLLNQLGKSVEKKIDAIIHKG